MRIAPMPVVRVSDDGRPNFHKLLFRRDWPWFFAFDLLALDGRDLRQLPLMQRKGRLKAIMPVVESRIRYVEHVDARGLDLFRAVCDRDLEGSWARGDTGRMALTPRERRG